MPTKEKIQEDQYHFPYHHLTHEKSGALYIFRHLFWGMEHYTYIQFVIDQILKTPYVELLDAGCGEGRIIMELEKKNGSQQHYGIDISKNALSFARGFCENADFSEHDITQKPFTKKVDCVVSCEVIEHILPEKISLYVKNIAQSLKPGGILYLTTPTTNVPTNAKHYQHFTSQILEDYLKEYFVLEEIQYLNKVNALSKTLNRIIANRVYISNIHFLNKLVFLLYKKYTLFGTDTTGSRIFIKAVKK